MNKDEPTPRADLLEEMCPDETFLKMDGHDNALVGYAQSLATQHKVVAIYDADKVIENLVDRDGMTYAEAQEFYEFNIAGAFVGESTPLLMHALPADVPNKIPVKHIERLLDSAEITTQTLHDKVTVVSAKFSGSDFVITEDSACVDPANYNHEVGYKYALAKIVKKLWELEGYRLACARAGTPLPGQSS